MVLGVTLIVFFMIHLVPGDPARTMLGVHASPKRIAILRHEWGLDQSLLQQYKLFMTRLLHGNLGVSLFYHVTTWSLIKGRLPVTLWLIVYGTVLSILISLPLAMLAATRKDGMRDQTVRAVPLVGLGFPPFWLGIMLLLAFGLNLGRHVPGRRIRHRVRRPPAFDVPAGADGRARDLAHTDPQPAGEPPAGARVGLHHDGPLEGTLGAAGHGAACAPKRRRSRR